MMSTKLRLFILFVIFQFAIPERRIQGGDKVQENQPYMVYLVKSPTSPRAYDAWMCGGSLVTTQFIVTSAACVQDVQHMYAIAGYKKRIRTEQLYNNQCTRSVKKKIVYTCVPKAYELVYDKIEKWANIDIAAAKVESPYDFESTLWKQLCSYNPTTIPINYEIKYQEAGVDAMVLGWGHKYKWRTPEETADFNEEDLHYASTLILDKRECTKYFAQSMSHTIQTYMICTLDHGNINDRGEQIATSRPIADGCRPNLIRLMQGDVVCEEDETVISDARRTYSNISGSEQNITRRQGICQNDHGGPLVTWVGSHEVLIGVASVFRVTHDSHCTGPYLFTSTQCNGAFLACVTSEDDKKGRRSICDKEPSIRGFDMVERHISWVDHPEGPADNEKMLMKPQVTEKLLMKPQVTEKLLMKPQVTEKKFIKPQVTENLFIRPQVSENLFIEPQVTEDLFIWPQVTENIFIRPQVLVNKYYSWDKTMAEQ